MNEQVISYLESIDIINGIQLLVLIFILVAIIITRSNK